MAQIVVVHGIGQQLEGPETQALQWRAPLVDGVRLSGGPAVNQADVLVAFYGDLFRASVTKGAVTKARAIEWTVGDVEDEFERELLVDWAEEAATLEDGNVPPKGGTPRTAQWGLAVLSRSRFFAGLADHVVIGSLKQVRRYFTDAGIRAAIRARVEEAIAPDTSVIVGHSLGSVVAYEALVANPDWPVRALVTLGSPLGIRRLVFDRLEPPPEDGRGKWPEGIGTWRNLSDKGDVVALAKRLAPLFDDRIEDISVNNEARAHDVSPYLTAKETGAAIAAALRE
jgi:hypothetical protein